ncbi:MAG: DHH family phosphoesterase [Oscillospiraceae bacterium]|nr:DHH family phosphoesterase [Oscillospiraceae bacterium]MBO5917442.1 DHH family phosphoesterase [Oscillospiraceae bacterium]
MNKKFSHLLEPNYAVYFFILVLFALASIYFSPILAMAESAVILLLALFYRHNNRKRKREIAKYMDALTGSVDVAAKDSMINSPLPMLIFRPERDEIVWSNERFLRLSGEQEHIFDSKLSAVVPGFDTRWLMEGKSEHPGEAILGERRFLVFGHLVRTGDKGSGLLATTYWVDVTDYSLARSELDATRPVAAVLLLDNYEDLMKNLNENQRSALISQINSCMDEWSAPAKGMLRKLERDRYLFLFQQQYLPAFTQKKFDILDAVHQVVNPNGIPASLSIGIGTDGQTFQELLQFANLSIDMALSRGGDQAVIRNRFSFEFYGGRSTEAEKRTKVKSRVMANALSSLIADSSRVLVMGHRFPDLDCAGAAAGVCAIARKLGVSAHIIRELGNPPCKSMTDKLSELEEYSGCFLAPQEAMVIADARTLLVVVDTNRPEQVQSPELLESCNRVAVIDHHRRAATYIDGAALNYHEPYASSACELVAELATYIVEPAELLRTEAEALLAGIVLDTKNFTLRTGGRTFEAAAFLRRSGADTSEVKKLFQNDFSATIDKYALIQNAQVYRPGIAIVRSERPVSRVTAAQAADELLNIMGIQASFVLFPDGEQNVILSARSIQDKINVQVILETLGGGGNAAAAGGQVAGKSPAQVYSELTAAIDQYLDT